MYQLQYRLAMLAKRLNVQTLPSMTGLDANGPKLPANIAVTLLTATKLPFMVYLKASSGFSGFYRLHTPGL